MIRLRRNAIVLRAVSIALALFSLLSSGRALVPGMCGTLAALNERPSANCSTNSCCSSQTTATAPAIHSLAARTECAFCHLATAIIQLEGGAVLTKPVLPSARVAATPELRLTEFERWNFARPRDPPALPVSSV